MEEKAIGKIRTSAIIVFAIVLLESLAGFSLLYTGIMYREYDEIAANELLMTIQETDPNYYALLNDPEQPEYQEEFRRLNTITGKVPFAAAGITLIAFALLTMLPAIIIFHTTSPVSEADGEGGGKDAKKGDDDDTF